MKLKTLIAVFLLVTTLHAHERNAFSFAQYYRQAGEKGLALEWYQKAMQEGGSTDQIFSSMLFSGLLLREMGLPLPSVIEALWRAHQIQPERAEAIYYLSECYDQMGNHDKAYECLHRAEQFSVPENPLTEMKWIEEYGVLFKRSLNSYWVGKYKESLDACDQLLAQADLPENYRIQIDVNRKFSVEKLYMPSTSTFDEALQPDKTVLIAILARNKAHVLPTYLRCLENFDYDKKLISIYINTNNNSDSTQEIVEAWAKENEGKYARIIFENHNLEGLPATTPHHWPNERLSTLAVIRNKSLRLTKELGCDYYFVADCDAFLAPFTLKELVKKELPIVAPMLRGVPETNDWFSNFFYNVDENGFWRDEGSDGYFPFFRREALGTVSVGLVHVAYLIRADEIDKLNYQREDGNYVHEWEYQTLARTARESEVDQFVCNEKDFGTTLHFTDMDGITLEEEAKFMHDLVDNKLDQYLDNFSTFMQKHLGMR